jgi:hypothetical protein
MSSPVTATENGSSVMDAENGYISEGPQVGIVTSHGE